MWALERPCATRAEGLFAETPRVLLVALALGVAATAALVEAAAVPPHLLNIAGVMAGHGALLATALAWARVRPAAGMVAVVLLGLAAAAAGRGLLGASAYLAPAFWVLWLAGRGQLSGLGLGARIPLRGAIAGALVGAGLSGHLLVSVSRTLGVHVRLDRVAEMLTAFAYDLGANVLAAECFFRGALFNRAQRRWSFALAATTSTTGYLLRYMVDPSLPKSVELVVGAVFYLALLGMINCWLFWWSGSLVPGFVSALVFFAAYRTLGPG